MAASLRPEVVQRLLLSKSLLARARFHPVAEPDAAFVAKEILTAHDAAELALGAIADQCNKLPPKDKCYLMDYFDSLKALDPSGDIPGRPYFRQLNQARIAIKHTGNFPDPKQWARVGERVYEYVDDWCTRYLVISLDELDESALLTSAGVKRYLDSAKQAMAQQNYEEVLVRLGKALHTLFDENSALRGLRVGVARPEDAIRLTGFGVHANGFLALQEFLPEIAKESDGTLRHKWKQGQFGHPANWREESGQFCLETFLDVALKVQSARWVPGALPFYIAYQHKITALTDGVKIESERRHLAGLGAGPLETLLGKRTRQTYRTLSKGESILGRVVSRDPISQPEDSAGLGNSEEAYEIRFSSSGFEMMGIQLFVAARHVKVTCVPNEFIRQYLPDLSEIDWEPV
jgi:hypothetical protein